MIEKAYGAIVLTAQLFNPSIFTEVWLYKHGLLTDNMEGVRIFSPEIVQFQTADIQVLISPPKIQITYPLTQDKSCESSKVFITKTIALLPETPYRGLGINFDYYIAPDAGQDFSDLNRNLLGSGDNPMLTEFNSKDARFGGYMSKDHGEARLKLDIKPLTNTEDGSEILQYSFNFHHPLAIEAGNDPVEKLQGLLQTWNELFSYTKKLIEMV